MKTEIEFLDISLTKDSSLLLHVIQSAFYWRILKKIILFSGFKKPYKKSAKQENSCLLMNSILYNGKVRVENLTNYLVWEESSLCPKTSTKNAVQRILSQGVDRVVVKLYGLYNFLIIEWSMMHSASHTSERDGIHRCPLHVQPYSGN
jgi:hypothetical protein